MWLDYTGEASGRVVWLGTGGNGCSLTAQVGPAVKLSDQDNLFVAVVPFLSLY